MQLYDKRDVDLSSPHLWVNPPLLRLQLSSGVLLALVIAKLYLLVLLLNSSEKNKVNPLENKPWKCIRNLY